MAPITITIPMMANILRSYRPNRGTFISETIFCPVTRRPAVREAYAAKLSGANAAYRRPTFYSLVLYSGPAAKAHVQIAAVLRCSLTLRPEHNSGKRTPEGS